MYMFTSTIIFWLYIFHLMEYVMMVTSSQPVGTSGHINCPLSRQISDASQYPVSFSLLFTNPHHKFRCCSVARWALAELVASFPGAR